MRTPTSTSIERKILSIALILGLPCHSADGLADQTSRLAVQAHPALLRSLGFTKASGVELDGSGVVVGIVEAGSGIPQLASTNLHMPYRGGGAGEIQIYPLTSDLRTDHATTVAGTIMDQFRPAGKAGAPDRTLSFGIAHQAQLVAAPINSTAQIIDRGTTLLQSTANGGFGASILNVSLHSFAPAWDIDGNSQLTKWLDWAATTKAAGAISDKLVVVAGNETNPNNRNNPWDNYNGITVSATTGANYKQLATYNGVSGVFNRSIDKSPYATESDFFRLGRFKTDITAPGGGDGTVLAAPVLKGGALDANGDGINDTATWGGTSFAAPHVAGVAALLTEYAGIRAAASPANSFSTDHRVLKAVILNGAKTAGLNAPARLDEGGNPMPAWTAVGALSRGNGAPLIKTDAAGGNATRVSIGWDRDFGTGLLDASASLANYKPGRMGPHGADAVATVGAVGWDLNTVSTVAPGQHSTDAGWRRDYVLPKLADMTSLIATLTWDRSVSEGLDAALLSDLDLELFGLKDGVSTPLAASTSDMDSMEHIFFDDAGQLQSDAFDFFMLRTSFYRSFGAQSESFALAWRVETVPEPATLGLVVLGALMFCRTPHRPRP